MDNQQHWHHEHNGVFNLERAKKRLMSEARYQKMPPRQTLLKLGLEPGMVFADVGCGIGFFALPAAGIIGSGGLVHAIDISSDMLKAASDMAVEEGLTNLQFTQSSENKIPLDDAVADMAFLGFVLHELPTTGSLLREVKRIMKPGGKLAVVERKQVPTEDGPPADHFLSPGETARLLVEAGFKITVELSFEPDHYGFVAEAAE